MRLIDADKLLRFFTVDTANQTYRFGTIKKQIENAETVKAIPIPDNATNGDVLKTVFPNMERKHDVSFGGWMESNWIECDGKDIAHDDWWNAPYAEKRGSEDGSN